MYTHTFMCMCVCVCACACVRVRACVCVHAPSLRCLTRLLSRRRTRCRRLRAQLRRAYGTLSGSSVQSMPISRTPCSSSRRRSSRPTSTCLLPQRPRPCTRSLFSPPGKTPSAALAGTAGTAGTASAALDADADVDAAALGLAEGTFPTQQSCLYLRWCQT